MIMKICWIVGSVLLILVVFSLGAFIPWCNHTISQIENKLATLELDREMRFRNLQWFISYDLKEGQIINKIHLLKLLKKENAIPLVEAKLVKQAVETVSKLHSAVTGQVASAELKNKWANMDIEQLQNEVRRLVNEENFSKLYDDIKKEKLELTKTEIFRMWVLVGTTMFQVIGLIMINLSQYFREYTKQKSPTLQ